MGVTINTNIASLMVQLSLKQASIDLDSSLQQLTTGYRINSAKDDAAGYTISQNILTKLRGYAVAQNNTSMGLSMINTATGSLDLINDNLSRLRNLVVQARTGTYGPDSISAMNREAESLVLEMERVRNNTEYNGIKIFEDKTGASQPAVTEKRQVGIQKTSDSKIMVTSNIDATESDTLGKFVNFGGGSKTVNVKDKNNAVVASFSLNSNTTVAEMQQKLRDNGINSVVSGGVITLMSTVGNYVEDASSNGAMTQMGISVLNGGSTTKKSGKTTTSTSSLTVTTERFATGSDKLGDIITLTSSQTINVYDSSNNITSTKSFSSNNTIDEVLSFLNSSNLTASINDGVISITSADGHYVKDSSAGGILSKLGISTNTTGAGTVGNTVQSSSAITGVVYATTSTKLADLGYRETEDVIFKDSSGKTIGHKEIGRFSSIQDVIDIFGKNGINVSFDEDTHSMSFSSPSGIYATHCDNLKYCLGFSVQNVCLSEAGPIVDGGVYYLSSVEDIKRLSNCISRSECTFILMNDINMSGVTGLGKGLDVKVVNFYGNGHVIKNYSADKGALIRNANNAYIYDLGMENTSNPLLNTTEWGGEITNCYTTGSISSSTQDSGLGIGGLVNNAASNTRFTNCYSTCNITINTEKVSYVGGFVGNAKVGSTFTDCYATGDILCDKELSYAGGFVGAVDGDRIRFTRCFATGNVTAKVTADYGAFFTGLGGFVGGIIVGSSSFDSCYATGNLTKVNKTPYGFAGYLTTDTTINNCYSKGKNLSGGYTLDFAPSGGGTITNSSALSDGENAPFTYSTVTGFITGVTHSRPASQPSIISSNKELKSSSSSVVTVASQIGSSGTINLINNGVEKSISISSSDTFNSIILKLADQGITASLTDGKFKINGGSSASYVKSIDSSLESALYLSGPYYSTSSLTTNTPSNAQKISTTSNITELTKFSDLGISSNMTINTVSNGVANTISVAPATTVSELLQMLRNIGFSASLSSGKLTIKGSETSYIESMDSALENVLKISGPYYSTSTITTKTNSASKKLSYSGTVAMNENTTLAELGITSNQNVIINQDKTDKTISLSKTDTLAIMLSKFSSVGLSGYISDGKLNINASNTSYIKTMPAPLKNAFKLSGAFSEEKEVTITPGFGIITGGHVINLQVGVDASPESVISFDTSFSLVGLATILANGLTADDLLDKIDATIETVTAKQTMLGAVANRLDSVLESLNINYMNQSSALSTIRDVDIAKVSSKYIRSMILSQASASLLTTANQAPSIALTLIRGFGR